MARPGRGWKNEHSAPGSGTSRNMNSRTNPFLPKMIVIPVRADPKDKPGYVMPVSPVARTMDFRSVLNRANAEA